MDGKFTMEYVLAKDPLELAEELYEEYHVDVPRSIDTVDEMNGAQRIISASASNYAFLENMAQMLRIMKRTKKRNGAEKAEVEDILSKEEAFSGMAEALKLAYTATSRLITLHKLVLDELHMSDGRGRE